MGKINHQANNLRRSINLAEQIRRVVNKLLKQFDQMKKLMKQMSSGKFKGFNLGGKKMKMPF